MNIPILAQAYRAAEKRLILLDYDGTLVGFNNDPMASKPTSKVLEVLKKLSGDLRNKVVIVSGRDHQTLEEWLGHLPVAFAAEHGLLYKEPGGSWQASTQPDRSWKAAAREVMEQCTALLPGSFVEEKTNALAWHCRASDAQAAVQIEKRLTASLTDIAERHKLRVMHGNKVIEIQPVGYSKGTAAGHWLENGPWEFILAAGDDMTDEFLFEAMPAEAFTIKIGTSQTVARNRLAGPTELLALLESLE